MARLREIISVALNGLGARRMRTLLIALGPMLGVAAIVGAVGMSESAKGDLKAQLAKLGTNLVVVQASDTFGGAGGTPVLPAEAVERAWRVPMVEEVSAVTELTGISVTPTEQSEQFFQTLPTSVRVADADLPDVFGVGLRYGRWINDADLASGAPAAVVGAELAEEFEFLDNETRFVRLNGLEYAVVGVLETVDLVPTANNSVFITPVSAKEDFDAEPEPTILYVRVEDGTTQEAVELLPVGIGLGGPETVTTDVPSSLLEAEAQVDKTLQAIVIAMGGLALIVGGVGIANVMSISVIQRSSEIGIRRALGHTRSIIATQFMIEAFLVGVAGGLAGALVGGGAVYLGADLQDWTFTLSPFLLAWACALAVIVATIAGIYPAAKAARLEPLETLRLG
jgi:putative ABC transport system permease protein